MTEVQKGELSFFCDLARQGLEFTGDGPIFIGRKNNGDITERERYAVDL